MSTGASVCTYTGTAASTTHSRILAGSLRDSIDTAPRLRSYLAILR